MLAPVLQIARDIDALAIGPRLRVERSESGRAEPVRTTSPDAARKMMPLIDGQYAGSNPVASSCSSDYLAFAGDDDVGARRRDILPRNWPAPGRPGSRANPQPARASAIASTLARVIRLP